MHIVDAVRGEPKPVSANLESLHKILKHAIRRKIVLMLLKKKELAYVDLMNLVGIENTGKLNYHLKILGDLIEKDGNGKYRLTEKGQLASQLLLRFPEKKSASTPLGGGDAALIGFIGFLVALVNPALWSFFLVDLFGMGILYLGAILSLVYALLVPSGVIWWLTIRRTNSHDPYDLFKPPLVTFALFMLALIFTSVLNIRLTISTPVEDSTYVAITLPSFPLLIISAFFSFLGVGISEVIYRVLEKTKF